MRAIKKDYTFQKVMETQKDLKDTDGFDWLESTELAIDKYFLNSFQISLYLNHFANKSNIQGTCCSRIFIDAC